jgi:hypothetical protein
VSHRALVATATATAVAALLSACGGETAADTAEGKVIVMEDDQLEGFVEQVEAMGVVEWRGQLLTKSPEAGGRRIFELSGRYSPSTGYSEVSMDSSIDGVEEQVDYLVVADRTYFNSDAWGPGSAECWVDITDDPARTWGLPTQLDPTWPVSASRAVRRTGGGVVVAVPAKAVLTGMPRGLFPVVPEGLKGIEARASVVPHGPLLEVGVDVTNMWSTVPEEQLASIDTKKAGWWAMTMQESRDGGSVAPPTHVFDPLVTPPRQCTTV